MASTIPQHANVLTNVDGQIYTSGDSITLTYSDLTPGVDYEIYVMALEGFFSSIEQEVTISGAGAPVTFNQIFNLNELFINDQIGDSSRSLNEYAQVITANGSGQIVIDVDPLAGTSDVVLGGIAILELETAGDIPVEGGEIADLTHVWRTINLNQSYTDPVVIVSPSSFNGADPTTVRVRNVTANSFEVSVYEWSYLNGLHGGEDLNYLVIESGTYTLADGTEIAAGVDSTVNHNWETINFGTTFSSTPVVLTQQTSNIGADATVTRHRNTSTAAFRFVCKRKKLKMIYMPRKPFTGLPSTVQQQAP